MLLINETKGKAKLLVATENVYSCIRQGQGHSPVSSLKKTNHLCHFLGLILLFLSPSTTGFGNLLYLVPSVKRELRTNWKILQAEHPPFFPYLPNREGDA